VNSSAICFQWWRYTPTYGAANAASDLWLRDALLVALGLRTMHCAAELEALRIEDVTWLTDRELLRVNV
jgi:hypothetical protein